MTKYILIVLLSAFTLTTANAADYGKDVKCSKVEEKILKFKSEMFDSIFDGKISQDAYFTLNLAVKSIPGLTIDLDESYPDKETAVCSFRENSLNSVKRTYASVLSE